MTLFNTIQHHVLVAALLAVAPFAASAQSPETQSSTTSTYQVSGQNRSILLVSEGSVAIQIGGWEHGNALRDYAVAHSHENKGNFILFRDFEGVTRLLADPTAVSQVQAMYEPMAPLNAEQRALSEQQKPLSAQQAALSAQMHGASPAEQGRIGAIQGRVGREQGRIGKQQGVIGREQGRIGKLVGDRLQFLADECLQKKTCPAVLDRSTT